MKKKVISITISLAITLGSSLSATLLLFSTTPAIVLKAESSIETIGLWAGTQDVSSLEKVYIPSSMVSLYREIGRNICAEESGDNIHYFSLTVGHPQVFYYYYATPAMGKVTNIRSIYNDVDSLVFVLSQIEAKANAYISNTGSAQGTDYATNLVLGYVRSFNDSDTYHMVIGDSINAWDIMAGSIDNNFIDYVESDESHGLLYQDYFSSFLKYSVYNITDHAAPRSQYQKADSDSVCGLRDPVSGNSIDLIHLFASLDGALQNTGANETFCSTVQGSREFSKGLSSWIGDLQTAAEALTEDSFDNNLCVDIDNFDFTDIMGETSYGCMEDDIDAINIAKRLLDGGSSISSAFGIYYGGYNRYSLFYDTYSSLRLYPNCNWTLNNDFELNCLFAVDVQPRETQSDGVDYQLWITNPVSFRAMFGLLYLEGSTTTTASIGACEMIANSFYDFVEDKASLEG